MRECGKCHFANVHFNCQQASGDNCLLCHVIDAVKLSQDDINI